MEWGGGHLHTILKLFGRFNKPKTNENPSNLVVHLKHQIGYTFIKVVSLKNNCTFAMFIATLLVKLF